MMLKPIAIAVLKGRQEAIFAPADIVSYSELMKNHGKKNPKYRRPPAYEEMLAGDKTERS